MIAFSWESGQVATGLQDPIFSWPIEVSNRDSPHLVFGHILATLALISSAFSLLVVDRNNNDGSSQNTGWAFYLFWQGLGGLAASAIGTYVKLFLMLLFS